MFDEWAEYPAWGVVIDAGNAFFGRGSVVLTRAGIVDKRTGSPKFEMQTPRYTTQVGELPIAVAGG